MKKQMSSILLLIGFLSGLSILIYPVISNYWNSKHQSRVVSEYEKNIEAVDKEELKRIKEAAQAYNQGLLTAVDRYHMSSEQKAIYNDLLDPFHSGVMGTIEITELNISLPIYHGIEERVLQSGTGHIPGTSLPIGGNSVHTVISGHRGLPSAKLLSDIDQMVEGDQFQLHILDEVLVYEVDQIRTVKPKEMDTLEIEQEKDYCTLVTCTPYGINTHRLLVRGHRVNGNIADGRVQVTSDANMIGIGEILPFILVPLLVILFSVLLIKGRKH